MTASPLIAYTSGPPAPWLNALGASLRPLPETIRAVVEADLREAERAETVLAAWDVSQAPLLGALCERLRRADRLLAVVCERRADVAVALVTGADWACVGPPDTLELQAARLARMRAGTAQPTAPAAPLETLGPIRIDDRRKSITVSGHELPLSPRLYDLLAYLVANPGRTVSRDDLLAGVWGLDFDPETNVVDVYMHYLRRALRPHGFDRSLVTVRGRGYRLDLEAAPAQA